MTPDAFDELLIAISSRLAPSEGDNLRGFVFDANALFGGSGVGDFRATSTSDPQELVRVSVRLDETLESARDAATILLRGWQSCAYRHFQATSLTLFREAARLRFVTVVSSESFFVSGTAFAWGARYSSLAATLEGRHQLPFLPGGLPDWVPGQLNRKPL